MFLCVLMAVTMFCQFTVPAFAAANTNYSAYNSPENSGDYAYWNGSRVVRSSSTTVSEVKWMQASLNHCIANKGLNASYLTVDGSFGPASKNATAAFQRAAGLSADGSFGSLTIKKMKDVLAGKAVLSNNQGSWMWPAASRRITCGFADNYYHTGHWHRGIDISLATGSDVYATRGGTVALVVGNTSSRGRFVVIDHGDGYYSEYQHMKSISVKVGNVVSQGQVIGKSGNTNGTSKGGQAHLHFEIMNLGKAGLGSKYLNYWNSYSKYVNSNPSNTDKVYCTKSNTGFRIRQAQGGGIPTADLRKTSKTAPYGVYCYDTNGINYIFK